MSKEIIGSLSVDLELLSAKFERGAKQANGQLDKLSKTATGVNKVFGALLAVGGGAAFSSIVKGSLDAANRLGDLSTRLGASVEGLSRLEYAAKLTGVSSNTLATGMQRATRRIADAANGSGEAVGALNELGLSATKLKELRPEQQFEVLADALEAVPDQADKVRLSMKILDSEGVSLLQTMAGGSAAIRAMGEESDATGNTISTKFAKSATTANAAMIKLGASGTALTNSIVSAMGPAIAEIANWLANNLPDAAKTAATSINLMAAGALKSLSSLVEFIRVPTYLLGKLSDEVNDVDKKLFAIQKNLEGAGNDILEKMAEGNAETEKFEATLGGVVVNLDDYRGKTESATQATKDFTLSQKAAKEAAKERTGINDKFEAVRASLISEEQAEKESYARRALAIQAFKAEYPAFEAVANQAAEAEKLRHETALTDMAKQATKDREKLAERERKNKVNIASGMFSNLSTLMNTESKRMFQIGKVASIASAVVSGLEAVTSSYAAGAKIGGPPLGAAFAATAAVATAAQVQQIKAQQFGGGGSVTAGTAGGAGPGVYQPPQPSIPTGPESQGRGVQIVFNGNVGNIEDVEQLAELIADHVETSDAIIVSDTSRNGQLLRAS